MKEDFLHYLWKYKKFDSLNLTTTKGEKIQIVQPGQHNSLAGPDFFNSQLFIGDQLWAGNVEVHIKSSDWYAHGHERDTAYDNVILHVVWEDDIAIFGKSNLPLPTLRLSDYVSKKILESYQGLYYNANGGFINCHKDFGEVPDETLQNWLERLYFERLERKVAAIELLLKESANDWEAVLFKMLARNFGTKINANSFQEMAHKIPFSAIRKIAMENGKLEALLLGFTQLLPEVATDPQITFWKSEFKYLRTKLDIEEGLMQPIQFFRLRPTNFPTIRLSQLAALYENEPGLFSKLISAKAKDDIYELFQVSASDYWDTHYNFGKKHKNRKKRLSRSFIDLLIINTVLPLRFAYAKACNREVNDELLDLLNSIKPERNSIVENFEKIKSFPKNGLVSQSLIQLKTNYCDANRCLKCAIGNHLISGATAGN